MKLLALVPAFLPSILAGDGCSEGKHCVCYDDVGGECYSEDSPWGGTSMRPLKALPDSPSKIGAEFRLYTQKNKSSYDLLIKDKSIPSNFNKRHKTVFMAHGFISSADEKGWMPGMKDKVLNHNDYNVVLVDWTNGANVGVFNIDYPKASQNTRVVGDQLGQLVKYLGVSQSDVHCIGHSLGAHLCGYGGKVTKFGRISGMDPAGPYFENLPDYVRLSTGDASFVDCIHTDGKPLYEAGFGMMQAIGHADFYPNEGFDQPGCRALAVGCSHGRSHQYYSDSIDASCDMTGHNCGSYSKWQQGTCDDCTDPSSRCSKMGWLADKNTKHQPYYLDTTDKSPWCLT